MSYNDFVKSPFLQFIPDLTALLYLTSVIFRLLQCCYLYSYFKISSTTEKNNIFMLHI